MFELKTPIATGKHPLLLQVIQSLFLRRLSVSKFKELQFADIVLSAIPLFPEDESDWFEFQSKKEKP